MQIAVANAETKYVSLHRETVSTKAVWSICDETYLVFAQTFVTVVCICM